MPSVKFLLSRIKNTPAKLFAGVLGAVVLAFTGSQIGHAPSPADLSESPFALASNMLAEWEDGGLIVFVRHLERCSRVDAACMEGESSGITERSAVIGLEMREQFSKLGLDKADMYSSPLTRTSQTSSLLFAKPTASEDFLYQCKKNFLQDAVEKKIPGRNLVLVTHSSCMDEVNKNLAYAEIDYEYGAAIFLSVESIAEQRMIGFIDTDDWLQALTPRS